MDAIIAPSPTLSLALDYETASVEFLDGLILQPSTIENYRLGLALFCRYAPVPLADLGPPHAHLLVGFVKWLLERAYNDAGETYAPSTAQIYTTAVRRWFKWLSVNGRLPPAFPYKAAMYNLREALSGSIFNVDRQPPEPPDIGAILNYYDKIQVPPGVTNPTVVRKWMLTSFRNSALVYALADSGGRVSEVLSLDVGDFPPRAFDGDVWRVKVMGKKRREYHLWFVDAMSHVAAYLKARKTEGDVIESDPLFVNHLRYAGRRMTRQSAWHMVSNAAEALEMEPVHPHDFRHWRATQLRNQGVTLEDVAFILGHRSLKTTQDYYAHVELKRIERLFRG